MTAETTSRDHAALMDGVYRVQRHFYDVTRKYYLLGRDHLIRGLDVPPGGTVLELGCGTGRNLVLAARRYPRARLCGLDISSEMLASAGKAIAREGLGDRMRVAQADATGFDAHALFGTAAFDRVFISYSLSMIPGWEKAIAAALESVAPGGSLHIVDFGRQQGWPPLLRRGLRLWLRQFHVEPRDRLRDVLELEAQRSGASLEFRTMFRGYAAYATVKTVTDRLKR